MSRRITHPHASVLLLFAVLLSGCNTKSPSSGSATAAPSTAQLTIAAASDLKFALDEILIDFRKNEPGLNVQVSYGSSGQFYSQLLNQAPFDLYLSADLDYVRKLSEAGKIVPGSEFQYAEGRIVVWVRNDSKLDLAGDGTKALQDPAVKKIAVANPQHAPYGRAAVAALKHFQLFDQLESKLVYGENIAQTAQFVESGAADVGIIALSLATAPALKEKGRDVAVPPTAHPPLLQGGAILNWAQDRAAAERLRAMLVGPVGRAVLQKYGFVVPGE
jgi:molybdate transport system substrate-binding protein